MKPAFIDERLAMLNEGRGFSDEFELEAWNYCDKNSSKLKAQYKEWTYAMKKEGSAFFKSVKTRANPAVKSAVKTVKERGKDVGKAYKGIRSKLRDLGDEKGKPRSHPSTAPSTSSFRKDVLTKQRRSAAPDISQSQAPYSALTPTSPDHGENSTLQFSPLNMDLMGDLQEVLFNKCSLLETPGQTPNKTIKPVRSFDNFTAGNGSLLENSVFHTDIGAAGSDDSVFLLGNKSEQQHQKPPTVSHKPEKAQVKSSSSETVDLIRLDSTPSDEFDPLENGEGLGHSLTNPLYPYFSRQASDTHRDMDLLREYGLDFNSISPPSAATTYSQNNWTKFD